MSKDDLNCSNCEKPQDLCVCESIRPLKTRLHVLILQHPQEPDKDLGSARIAHLALPNSTLKIGLSWPNLKAALGKEAVASRWAVLYLGSGAKLNGPPQSKPPVLQFVDKKGMILNQPVSPKDLDGIVVLDGTWSQAKALWWRNAWLLKLKRVVLNSPNKSLYKELRKEPRRECLSTIESIAETLEALKESANTSAELKKVFGSLLDKRRELTKKQKEARRNARASQNVSQEPSQNSPEEKSGE
jgi:DTW domain-containing protein YfiP